MTKLLKLYPKKWRERYGPEFEALLEQHELSVPDRIDVIAGGANVRLRSLHRSARFPRKALIATIASVLALVPISVIGVLAMDPLLLMGILLVVRVALVGGTVAVALVVYRHRRDQGYGFAWRRAVMCIAVASFGVFILLDIFLLSQGVVNPIILVYPALPAAIFALVCVVLFTAATAFSRHRRSAQVAR